MKSLNRWRRNFLVKQRKRSKAAACACGLIIIIIINIKCHYSCFGFISMKLSKRRNLLFNCESAVRCSPFMIRPMKMRRPDELIRVRLLLRLLSSRGNPGKYSTGRAVAAKYTFRKALFMLGHKFSANKQPKQTRHARKRCKWNLFGWFSLHRTWRNSENSEINSCCCCCKMQLQDAPRV